MLILRQPCAELNHSKCTAPAVPVEIVAVGVRTAGIFVFKDTKYKEEPCPDFESYFSHSVS